MFFLDFCPVLFLNVLLKQKKWPKAQKAFISESIHAASERNENMLCKSSKFTSIDT